MDEVINKRKGKSPLPSSLKSENRIPLRLLINSGNIRTVNCSFRSFLSGNNNSSITLTPTTLNELEDICSSFAMRKAPGYDNIPMHVIIISFHFISAPLLDIFNLSLPKCIFPDKLKIAKVIPIYKAGDPGVPSWIFLLPNSSTFFERVTSCSLGYV